MTAIHQAPPIDLAQPTKVHANYQSAPRRIAVDDVGAKRRLIHETPYEPNLNAWKENQGAYTAPKSDSLPTGFPEKVSGPAVWNGRTLIDQPDKWLYRFTTEDIDLLENAHSHFVSLNLTKNDITQVTFPISRSTKLYAALDEASQEIKTGLGLRVFRGLPVDRWERNKQLEIFAGISNYIGKHRIAIGNNVVTHLRDITNIPADNRPPIVVKGQTNGNQVFHNDGGAGIVGLITLGVAETGGLSQLSSVAQTYNVLASSRRDILRELAKDDWKQKAHPEGRALFHVVNDDQVISSYSRRPYFGFYEADADRPPLPKQKHLALDAIHFTAEQGSLDLDLQKGDLEYFNNATVFHARTASEDSEENQRHLVRIWLRNEEQPLPEALVEYFQNAVTSTQNANGWPLEAW